MFHHYRSWHKYIKGLTRDKSYSNYISCLRPLVGTSYLENNSLSLGQRLKPFYRNIRLVGKYVRSAVLLDDP